MTSTSDSALKKPLKVIGAGVMRTGTLSLRQALERLLSGSCYHMHNVAENMERIQFWTNALETEPSDEEFQLHYQDFLAAVDFPTAGFYRRLADIYPDAKIILTVRDRRKWFQSSSKTVVPSTAMYTAHQEKLKHEFGKMAEKAIRRVFGNIPFDNEELMIEAFDRHVEEVKKTIHPDRLLVFEVKDGWQPLCEFLGVPIPDEPFPVSNTSETFKSNFLLQ